MVLLRRKFVCERAGVGYVKSDTMRSMRLMIYFYEQQYHHREIQDWDWIAIGAGGIAFDNHTFTNVPAGTAHWLRALLAGFA